MAIEKYASFIGNNLHISWVKTISVIGNINFERDYDRIKFTAMDIFLRTRQALCDVTSCLTRR